MEHLLCSRSVQGTDDSRVNEMDIVSALRNSQPSMFITIVRSYESIDQGSTHGLWDRVGLEKIQGDFTLSLLSDGKLKNQSVVAVQEIR